MCGVNLEALGSLTVMTLDFFPLKNSLKIGLASFPNTRRCSMLVGRPQMCGVILEELDSIALTVLKSFQIKIYYKLAEPDF